MVNCEYTHICALTICLERKREKGEATEYLNRQLRLVSEPKAPLSTAIITFFLYVTSRPAYENVGIHWMVSQQMAPEAREDIQSTRLVICGDGF